MSRRRAKILSLVHITEQRGKGEPELIDGWGLEVKRARELWEAARRRDG